MRTFDWIVFDLGDVVVRLNREARYETTLATANSIPGAIDRLNELLKDNFVADQLEFSVNEQFQRGEIEPDAFLQALSEAVGHTLPLDVLHHDSLKILGPEIEGTSAIIRELKAKGFRVACFSNTHAIHWAAIIQNYPVMKEFDYQGASHLLREAKPTARSYDLFCEKLGTTPERCVFVDDRDNNIRGAEAVGMEAILFTGPDELRVKLKDLGVL